MQNGLASVLLVVYMVAFMYGVVLIFEGAWKTKNGNPTEAQEAIISAMILAVGPIMIETLFNIFGIPGAFSI
jgi:hypothetical protein